MEQSDYLIYPASFSKASHLDSGQTTELKEHMKRISILKGTVSLIIKFLSPFLNKSIPDVQRLEIVKRKIVSAQFGCPSIGFHVHFLEVHCMSHT